MSAVDWGGSAFPSQRKGADGLPVAELDPGMTLRDYFAAKAMQGELASMRDNDGDVCGIALDASDETMSRLAKHYYRIADAMLKARSA